MFERIGDLSDDREADDRRFEALAASDPVAAEGSISEDLRNHLTRDVGPAQIPFGGDWLPRMPLSRSMSRGPGYAETRL